MNKKRIIILWFGSIFSIVITVFLWFCMNAVKPEYEKVEAVVLSSKVEQVVNRKTKTRTNIYRVQVEYKCKSYNLGNVHSASGYYKGRRVQAYLYQEKLYANIEGVKTSTPVAYLYFTFLFGSFALFFITVCQTSQYSQSQKKLKSV